MNTPTRPLHFSGPRLGILARNDSRPSESVARSATRSGGIMDEIARNVQGNHRWDQQTQEKFQAMVAEQKMLGGAPPSGLEIRMEDKRLHISMGKFNDGIVAATPPAVTTFGFSNDPSGVEVVATETMESYLTKQGDIIAVLRDSEHAAPLLQVRYRSLGKHAGWKLDIDHPAFAQVLPAETDLYELNFGLWTQYYALDAIAKKISKHTKTQLQSSNDPLCLNHDFECTDSPDTLYLVVSNILITCVREVNIHDCCTQHDIDLWCGLDITGIIPEQEITDIWKYPIFQSVVLSFLTIIAFKLYMCIIAKFVETGHKAPFWCHLGTGGILGYAQGVVEGLLYFLVTSVAPISQVGSEYFPIRGTHDHSCLCGGNEPTVLCSDKCRNLCLERNKNQSCYRCSWDCQYDKGKMMGDGRLLGVRLRTDPNMELQCCPETDPNYKYDCKQDEMTALKKCPQCYPCEWECHTVNGRQKRFFREQNKNNLPCCPGTRIPEDRLGDWCKEQGKTKGMV